VDVSDVLRDRTHEPAGLESMATLSILAHGVFIASLLLAPGLWRQRAADTPASVMVITLGGGASGPSSGGMTSMSARPIQEVKPPEEASKPEPVRPPATKTPEMTLPEKNAKPAKATRPVVVKEAPDDAKGHTPTRGDATRSGSAAAETGVVRGQGFGLSGGGGAGADGSYLDVSDFCCPEYLTMMKERITRNWTQRSGTSGDVMVKFTIQRDGTITGMTVERSSGNWILDSNAQKALYLTRQLPPLPAAFPNPSLTVHLNFKYQ